MAGKKTTKRLGKKHRQASTRPRQGKSSPRANAVTGAIAPKKRKQLAAKKAAAATESRRPTQSPDRERKRTLTQDAARASALITRSGAPRLDSETWEETTAEAEQRAWHEAERLAARQTLTEAEEQAATAHLPLIAICGRPNVGKSTLFNRLTESRRSIVGDEPGITRDRIYGEVEWQGRTARLVDTGGVVPDDEDLIPAEIFRQARAALDEADVIIMVTDGRTELTAPDIELARLLQRSAHLKPLFLAVNKIDSPELAPAAENYRTLGFKNVLPVSAEHASGIGDLLDEVWAVLPPDSDPANNDDAGAPHLRSMEMWEETTTASDETTASPERKLRSHGEHISRETKIAIIGRPNVGKSTLLNALTGTDRAIVSPIAGTTRDAVDEVVERNGHSFRFIDTAGIRRKGKTKLMAEKLSVIMSRKHLESADVSLLVIDATEGVTGADANIGGYAHESGRSVIILVNKWDLVTTARTDSKPPADKKVYEQQVRDSLKFLDYAPLLFTSAAESKGIEEIFKKVELVARERRKRITTGDMNRFLAAIDFQRATVPMNRRVKIYYMTQAAVAPPTFVLFTDRDVKLHFSYERFLENEIRRSFRFIGTPIWFKIKARNKKKIEA